VQLLLKLDLSILLFYLDNHSSL